MLLLKEKQFSFVSHAPGLAPDTFSVVRFSGDEGVSQLFKFEITLVSKNPEIDFIAVLSNRATLYLGKKKKIPVHGILSSFDQLNKVDDNIIYKAVLVPKVWKFTRYRGSRVYLGENIEDILQELNNKPKLTTDDEQQPLLNPDESNVELIGKDYKKLEFVCQYQENHFNFASRLIEREGIYYFFDHGDDFEVINITDSVLSHTEIPGSNIIRYAPPSGLDAMAHEDAATGLFCRQKLMPQKVILRNFNYRKGEPIISAEALVSENGHGELFIYGENVNNNDEAQRYANIRAEEIKCRQSIFYGRSNIYMMRSGHVYGVNNHYRPDFNQKYMVTKIHHEGSQAALLTAGTGKELSEADEEPYYWNTFEGIPADVQFRPCRETPKPQFYGSMNATVDADGDGKYAMLDSQGRYKVKLPFDLNNTKGGKASGWIRLAEPYAGPDEGMHFPLRKGAEVILTFIEGDLDRPIISSAVSDVNNPNVVDGDDSSENIIRTAGGNKIIFQDLENKQQIMLYSPTSNTYFRLGTQNNPDREVECCTTGQTILRSEKDFYVETGGKDYQVEKLFGRDFEPVLDDKDKQKHETNPEKPWSTYDWYSPKKDDRSNFYISTKEDFKQSSHNIVQNARNILKVTTGFGLSEIKKIAGSIKDFDDDGLNDETKLEEFVKHALTGTGDPNVKDPIDFKTKELIVDGSHREHVLHDQIVRVKNNQNTKVKGNQETTVEGWQKTTVDGKQTIKAKGDRDIHVDGKQTTTIDGDWDVTTKHWKLSTESHTHTSSGADLNFFGGMKLDISSAVNIGIFGGLDLAIKLLMEISIGLTINLIFERVEIKFLDAGFFKGNMTLFDEGLSVKSAITRLFTAPITIFTEGEAEIELNDDDFIDIDFDDPDQWI